MSISKELNLIIDDIEKSAKTARMISLNAGVIAVRTRSETNESYAFEAVADQINRISEESVGRLTSLRSALDDLHDLTRTINIAGRQRMISQRIMKLYFIEYLEESMCTVSRNERQKLQNLFEKTLSDLRGSRLCNREIEKQLNKVEVIWQRFTKSMEQGNMGACIPLNDEVLAEMNKAVVMFEALGG
ncbi:type IV pili methyl-accepting chemotaxis transducer N-terminal domain-containing protein [Puniceicoccaceae bacterium K14]|nr:type IV pili methyl-accepting chemotaxis transducer N-terminal domain-containing protein [Puniceicoccaceae bacterium K14]